MVTDAALTRHDAAVVVVPAYVLSFLVTDTAPTRHAAATGAVLDLVVVDQRPLPPASGDRSERKCTEFIRAANCSKSWYAWCCSVRTLACWVAAFDHVLPSLVTACLPSAHQVFVKMSDDKCWTD
jgi:hypothetical protein